MITNSIKKLASFVNTALVGETPITAVQLADGTIYPMNKVKWVYSTIGPTGIEVSEGLVLNFTESHQNELINNGNSFYVQINPKDELVVHLN
jgi:uncharacterized protein YrrD